jgi:hypothetical protein
MFKTFNTYHLRELLAIPAFHTSDPLKAANDELEESPLAVAQSNVTLETANTSVKDVKEDIVVSDKQEVYQALR